MEYFTRHPNSVGMTYFEHAYFSIEIAFYMSIGGVKAIIHAINPNWYEDSTTKFLEYLTEKMNKRQE